MITVLAAALAVPSGYEVVRQLDLTTAFRTRTAWTMTVLQPTGAYAEMPDKPAKVCLTGGQDGATACQDVIAEGYRFQTVKDAKVETLSAKAGAKGVAVRSEYAGPSYVLRRTDLWTYDPARDAFTRTAGFSRGGMDDEELFAAGEMDGIWIIASHLMGKDETRWSDHRYAIEVYRLDLRFGGYVQVLQYLSPSAYPSERNGPHDVIDRELTRTRRLMAAVQAAPK